MKVRIIAACLLAALAARSPSFAQGVSEGRLSQAVARIVRGDPQVTIFDHVDFHVEGSTVTLDGQVTTPAKRAALERNVAALDGVTEVRNTITVLPPVPSDNDLRQRLARAIYGNPAFWSYAALSNPPIHIIVERGRVTLRGCVNTQGERTMARSLASSLAEGAVMDELVVNR
jgi:hyperosmotically inducible periplasmic protein